MREVLVISGKGGTGKTSLMGAFASLAENKVLCDLDVDAPDLHILLDPDVKETKQFYSGREAIIDTDLCTRCGQCLEVCRFNAILERDEGFAVDPLRCEGCKVCVALCPAQAIDFPEKHCGKWYVSDTRFGPLVHAQLFPGEENSGRLVTALRQHARQIAEDDGYDLILCDGTPGVGCPVISSLSGVSLAVVVTEPTLSGRHDMRRVLELCAHFKVPAAVIINKCDLSAEGTAAIEADCRASQVELIARLPYDAVLTKAMTKRKVVTEMKNGAFGDLIQDAWARIKARR